MKQHYLQLNAGKTELIVFGSQSVLSKLKIKGVFLNSQCIRMVSTVKNLGFRMDSSLILRAQITALKSSCFHKLRNIAKMKYYLSPQQMQVLVQSLVISSLDYCNALYYGLNSSLLNQLQVIQNRACRTVLGLKRKDAVSEHLQHLHWLKIEQRIEFKILLLVFKSLNNLAPTYLSELIQYNNISGSRPPSLKSPTCKTGAFISAAPALWNKLPNKIRQTNDIEVFKKLLKTHLFIKCYSLDT